METRFAERLERRNQSGSQGHPTRGEVLEVVAGRLRCPPREASLPARCFEALRAGLEDLAQGGVMGKGVLAV